MYIRVRVDLRRVLGARAARARVLLRVPAGAAAAALPAAWLLRRLRALLAPAPAALARARLALRVRGHLLPPREALAVLRAGDTVQVYPLNEDDDLVYDADEVLPMDNETVISNKERKICEHSDEKVQQVALQPEKPMSECLRLEEEKQRALQLLDALPLYSTEAPCGTKHDSQYDAECEPTCFIPSDVECETGSDPAARAPRRRRRVRRRRRPRSPAPAPSPTPAPAPPPTPANWMAPEGEGAGAARRGRAVRALDIQPPQFAAMPLPPQLPACL